MIACLIWRSALFAFRDEIGFGASPKRSRNVESDHQKEKPQTEQETAFGEISREDISQGGLYHLIIGPLARLCWRLEPINGSRDFKT